MDRSFSLSVGLLARSNVFVRFGPRLVAMLALAAVWGVMSGIVATRPAFAAAFSCSGNIYQVQSGQLRVFDPIASTYVNVGAGNGSYNDGFFVQSGAVSQLAAPGTR